MSINSGTRKQLDSETRNEEKRKEKAKWGVRINHLARMVGMDMTSFIYFSFFLVNKNLVSKSKF